MSFRHAVELLRADAGLTPGHVVRTGTVRKLEAPVTAAEDAEAL